MMTLRVLFRCWFYDLSCHRSKLVTKLPVRTAVFGEPSHRISQTQTIVANGSIIALGTGRPVAQTFLDVDDCRMSSIYFCSQPSVAQTFLDVDDCRSAQSRGACSVAQSHRLSRMEAIVALLSFWWR